MLHFDGIYLPFRVIEPGAGFRAAAQESATSAPAFCGGYCPLPLFLTFTVVGGGVAETSTPPSTFARQLTFATPPEARGRADHGFHLLMKNLCYSRWCAHDALIVAIFESRATKKIDVCFLHRHISG